MWGKWFFITWMVILCSLNDRREIIIIQLCDTTWLHVKYMYVGEVRICYCSVLHVTIEWSQRNHTKATVWSNMITHVCSDWSVMVELYCVIHSGLLDQCIVCYLRYDNSVVIFVLHLQRLCQFSALVPLTAASTASAFQSTPPAARHHHSSFSSSHISTSSSQHTVALNTHYYPYPPFPFLDPYNNNPCYQNNNPCYNHPYYQSVNPY